MAKIPWNNNQTPGWADWKKKKHHRFLDQGNPGFRWCFDSWIRNHQIINNIVSQGLIKECTKQMNDIYYSRYYAYFMGFQWNNYSFLLVTDGFNLIYPQNSAYFTKTSQPFLIVIMPANSPGLSVSLPYAERISRSPIRFTISPV